MALSTTTQTKKIDWRKQLLKLEGAKDPTVREDVHKNVVRIGSPSADFTFGHNWGLPHGYTLALWGPPKAGKSLITYGMMADLHAQDPEAWALKVDAEFRDAAQLSQNQAAMLGVDLNRYQPLEVNSPEEVFDQIETKVAAMCQDGFPLKLIVIDSINGILGLRQQNADGIAKITPGDLALTLGAGFKRILRVQRKFGISVVLNCQVRAEFDQWVARRNGHNFRMAAAAQVQHYAEYFMFCQPMKAKEHKADMLGNSFEDTSKEDMLGKHESTAHKIAVTMTDASFAPKGRSGLITFDYKRGIINKEQEAFVLGTARNVIHQNGAWYNMFGEKYQKKDAVLALEKDPTLMHKLLNTLRDQEKNAKEDVLNADTSALEEGLAPVFYDEQGKEIVNPQATLRT